MVVGEPAGFREIHVRQARTATEPDDRFAHGLRGGADPDGGSGLRGLADRLAALGGELSVESPPGEGTAVIASIPCA